MGEDEETIHAMIFFLLSSIFEEKNKQIYVWYDGNAA